MAMKFSATGLFVSDLKSYVRSAKEHSLKEKEVKKLKEILVELKGLHYTTEFEVDTRVVNENIDLTVTREFVVSSRDPIRTGELFHQIDGVLRSHFVDVGLYIRLGEAFGELGIETIDADLKIAIETAKMERSYPEHSWSGGKFCPEAAIRRSRKER